MSNSSSKRNGKAKKTQQKPDPEKPPMNKAEETSRVERKEETPVKKSSGDKPQHKEKKDKKKSPLNKNSNNVEKSASKKDKKLASLLEKKSSESTKEEKKERVTKQPGNQEKKDEIGLSSNVKDQCTDSKQDGHKRLSKKMDEEGLDDEEKYPYYHKHPILYAILVPDNTDRGIVYINKPMFSIARRRTADYVICDRRVSNDGVRIQVVIDYDRAEISIRRFSSSPVYINDNVQLEYRWLILMNGDTLTFADGSRYIFYNLYNQRDMDEIHIDEGRMVHYVRQNVLDEERAPQGKVMLLSKDTSFDDIDHSHSLYELVDSEDGDGSMVIESDEGRAGMANEHENMNSHVHPLAIHSNIPNLDLPMPFSTVIPSRSFHQATSPPPPSEPIEALEPQAYDSNDDPENRDGETKKEIDLEALKKELLDRAYSINSRIVDNLSPKRSSLLTRKPSEKDDPFMDGTSSTTMAGKAKKTQNKPQQDHQQQDQQGQQQQEHLLSRSSSLVDAIFDNRLPVGLPINMILRPSRTRSPTSMMSRHMDEAPGYGSNDAFNNHIGSDNDSYDNEMYLVYRSKEKTMIATAEVYDYLIDAFFREMMDGIDLDDIRKTLTQSTKEQNKNYRKLIRETVDEYIVKSDQNSVTFENCGYPITESFKRYCSLLFQSYIANSKYVSTDSNAESKHSYPSQFIRMECENGRQYVSNIVYSLANELKADLLPFNYQNNILIEGTPLCYRKYLFGLFPSSIHIKSAQQAIPKSRAPRRLSRNHSGNGDEIYLSDPIIQLLGDEFIGEDGEDGMGGEDGMMDVEFAEDDHSMEDEVDVDGAKNAMKDDDDIMEGDIVVVSPLKEATPRPNAQYRPVYHSRYEMLRFNKEMNQHKEKERRAVVVKVHSNRLIVRYLDKDENDTAKHPTLLPRHSIDCPDPTAFDPKRRQRCQQLARSLHSCSKDQVRKWVDEDDQKFLLMKTVNDILMERHEAMKGEANPRPFFIVFEDAPFLIKRRNGNILSLLNVHERTFSFPLFVILTEKSLPKSNAYSMGGGGNMMMLGGLSMIMQPSRRVTDGRSGTEQQFDHTIRRAFTLPYAGIDLTLQNDIMVIDVPVPADSKFKYTYERRVEEDEKTVMRTKHIKELDFFLRAHHLHCPDLHRCRYLDIKRIRNWVSIIRIALSLQVAKGMTFKAESELYDIYNKTKDSIDRTGKQVYVSENTGNVMYGMIDRKNLEYAVKVVYNIQKESQPDSTQEVRTRNESEKRLLANGSLISPNDITVGFEDVGSLENVKAKLQEAIVLPLRRPEIFAQSSLLKSCKGLLLFGPPGTGKTMLAKALARESGANFLSIATSTIFNKYVGESEQNTRAIFTLAARLSPCVIFIDEIDAILSSRHSGNSDDYMRKVKNEFMSCWDGLTTDEHLRVVVVGCTNRPFDLDDAVLRRFSRKLLVDLPDSDQREKILRVILRKERLSDDVDLKQIASDGMTKGFSGSDLFNLCQAAAYFPVREIMEKEKTTLGVKNGPKMDSMGMLMLESDDEEENEEMKAQEKASEVTVRPLTMKDFEKASKEITFSFEESSSAIRAIREWNEKYGDSGSRKSEDLSYYI